MPPVEIVAEYANIFDAFRSNVYVIGELSTNEALIEKWILSDTILLRE